MLAPQAIISDAECEQGLRRLVYEAAFSNTTAALTTGVILTAFALHLGASNAVIGLLAALPFLSQLTQVPAIALIERLRQRKRIAVLSSAAGRTMLGLMALLPFVPGVAIGGLVFATAILCIMGAIGGCAWNAWLRDLAPEDRMGSIFARRTVYATFTTIIAGAGAALALELTPPGSDARAWSFCALYAVGCAAGLISVGIVARIPEPQMPAAQSESAHLLTRLRTPLADRNFARLLRFLGSWQFAINLATPFFTVYLVEQLGYSMTIVMGLSIASQIANVVALRNWGALADRFSNKSVLLVAAPAYILSILGMIGASQIAAPPWRLAWLALLHLFMGGAVAGVTLATANIALKLSPRGTAASYLATSGVVTAAAAGSAPILGGLFADFFSTRHFELLIRWTSPDEVHVLLPIHLTNWDFYFLLSGLLGFYALHRLSLVRETGEISRREMVDKVLFQTRSSIHNFSTVTGLRTLTEVPSAFLREAQVQTRFFRMQLSRGLRDKARRKSRR